MPHHKKFSGSNTGESCTPNTEVNFSAGSDSHVAQSMQGFTKISASSPGKSNKICCTNSTYNNKILSTKIKKRLQVIREITASVGDDPVVKVGFPSINECFTCSICKGYLYKATTITECLHTFCKGCLVKHLTFNLNCPKCNILIHPTDPLVNIRSDSMIQDLLYKLLPNVEKEELVKEILFCKQLQSSEPSSQKGSAEQQKRGIKRKSSGGDKTGCTGIYVGLEITLLACCYEGVCEKLPQKAYFSVPMISNIKNMQNFLEDKLGIPSDAQVNLFIDGYLINPLLTVEKLWNVFSSGDILENILHLSYAIMSSQDYFTNVDDPNS